MLIFSAQGWLSNGFIINFGKKLTGKTANTSVSDEIVFPLAFTQYHCMMVIAHSHGDIFDLEGELDVTKQPYYVIDRTGTSQANSACTWVAVGY